MPALRSVLREALVAAEAFGIAVHDGDENRRQDLVAAELAEVLQRRHQARDADGEAGGRHRLAREARDQPVIAPAAADRAEDDLFALFVGDVEGQFGFVDRAGVVFEAADDGGVDLDAVGAIAGSSKHSAIRSCRARSTPSCDRFACAGRPVSARSSSGDFSPHSRLDRIDVAEQNL